MTSDELNALRETAQDVLRLEAKATPGPWGICHGEILTDPGVDRLFVMTEEKMSEPAGDSYNVACVGLASNSDSLPDGRFIAAAREATPALARGCLALLDAATECDRLREAVKVHQPIQEGLALRANRAEAMLRKVAKYLQTATDIIEESGEDEDDIHDAREVVAEALAIAGEGSVND